MERHVYSLHLSNVNVVLMILFHTPLFEHLVYLIISRSNRVTAVESGSRSLVAIVNNRLRPREHEQKLEYFGLYRSIIPRMNGSRKKPLNSKHVNSVSIVLCKGQMTGTDGSKITQVPELQSTIVY